MKKIIYSAVACLALSTFAVAGGNITPVVEPVVEAPVAVAGNFYVGGGVSFLTWEDKFDGRGPGDNESIWRDEEASWTGGTILAGYRFNPYLAVEGRYTMSFTDASWEVDGNDAGDSDDDLSNIAIYLKPMFPVGEFTLYGLIGYGKTTMKWEGGSEDSDSGFQWGVGAAMDINDRLSVFVDYTVMYDDDKFDSPGSDEMVWGPLPTDFKVDAITLGVTYTF